MTIAREVERKLLVVGSNQGDRGSDQGGGQWMKGMWAEFQDWII